MNNEIIIQKPNCRIQRDINGNTYLHKYNFKNVLDQDLKIYINKIFIKTLKPFSQFETTLLSGLYSFEFISE